MNDDFNLQSILAKINKFSLRSDIKDDSQFDFQAQRIYGFIRDSYKAMKCRNDGTDYYEYYPDFDMGVFIRNTDQPYFGVALRLNLLDLEGFQKFCNEFIHDSGLSKNQDSSNLEFFIGLKDENNTAQQKKMRCNYSLGDDPKFLDHAIEGCTHTFCKGLMKEFEIESFDLDSTR